MRENFTVSVFHNIRQGSKYKRKIMCAMFIELLLAIIMLHAGIYQCHAKHNQWQKDTHGLDCFKFEYLTSFSTDITKKCLAKLDKSNFLLYALVIMSGLLSLMNFLKYKCLLKFHNYYNLKVNNICKESFVVNFDKKKHRNFIDDSIVTDDILEQAIGVLLKKNNLK